MRILQFITELTPAGAERIVCELSKGLKKKGYTVLVVSIKPLSENDIIIRELQDGDIDVLSLNVTKITLWRVLKLRKIISDFKPDIIHSHLIHPNIIARLAKIASSEKFKLINTVHIAERRIDKQWHFFLDKITLYLCDCQTAVSKAVRDFHSQKISLPPESMPVIYNGIPKIEKISQQRISQLRKLWEVSDCAKVIGSVGRLDPQKGYDILLKQLPQISGIIPENEKWALVIIGEGPQRPELEKIILSLNLQNITVRMPGFMPDAARNIGAFDIFVMPSRYEGFGLTLIEAMMQGVPVLSSHADSLPELISCYSNGKCMDFTNTRELIENIRLFIHHPNQKTGKHGRNVCTAENSEPQIPIGNDFQFSVDTMVRKYINLYQRFRRY